MFRHLRNYATAGLVSALVGVVSFPIMTRNLSIADYGLLGLIASSITLFVAVGKLGVQHALVRFCAQIRHGNSRFDSLELHSTVGVLFLAFAGVTTALWLLAGHLVLPHVLQSEEIGTLFSVAAGVVFVRLLGSGVINFLRARQRSGAVALSQTIARGANLALILVLLFAGGLDLHHLLICLLLAELAGVTHAAWRYRPDFSFARSAVSAALTRAMLVYGLPLMLLEALGLVLRLSDRYLIEALLGVTELGQYAASYNLVAYLDLIVLAALVQALKPRYLQIWESEGAEPTRRFLAGALRVFLVVGAPSVALFSLTGPHLLGLLAGERYLPGTAIIPLITLSFLLEGAVQFSAAGLHIREETRSLMLWGAVASAVNLALNVAFIPVYGIVGAASVTVLSYLVFGVGVTFAACRHLRFRVPLRAPLIMALASALVYALLGGADFGPDVVDLIAKGALGAAPLAATLIAVDAPTRRWLHSLVRRVRDGRGPRPRRAG